MDDPDRCVPVDVRLREAFEAGTLPKQLMCDSAAGTGKTFGILTVLHCLLADYPRLRFLMCRRTRASLTDSAMVTYEQEILPADGMEALALGQARKNRHAYNYPNGSEFVMAGLDRPGKVLSTAWDLIFVNECVEVAEDGIDALAGRLNRPGRSSQFGYLLLDTNPGDPAHYLKKRADAREIGRWQVDHRANPAMFDGRDWTPAGLLYLATLGKVKGTRRKRFLEGIWAAGEGQWYESFGDFHVSKLAAFHPHFPVYLAIDSGVHTAAVWFQVRGSGGNEQVTVFGDYYAFNRSAYDNALAIVAHSWKLGCPRLDRITTDPSGKASTAVGPTVLGEYQRAGLKTDPWPSYPGSVLDGLTLIESFVSVDPPGLLVHPDCSALVEGFANFKRAKRSGQFIDRPEDPQHPYEDIMDSLRGGLMDKWPEGRKLRPVLPRVPIRSVF